MLVTSGYTTTVKGLPTMWGDADAVPVKVTLTVKLPLVVLLQVWSYVPSRFDTSMLTEGDPGPVIATVYSTAVAVEYST
jgi:hypothetical protein